MENLLIEDFDPVIVGAGLAGVSLAAEARAAGGAVHGLTPAGTDHAEQLDLDATSAASPAEPQREYSRRSSYADPRPAA